jgi:ribosomal protein L21E
MQAVGGSCVHSPALNSFAPQDGYQGVTRANLLNASSRKSTDISLITAEGDKVTISAQSAFRAGFASYDYQGRLSGNEVNLQSRSLEVASENSLTISVEGNLSQDELADIKKLVTKIEKLGSEFFSRPLEDSLSQALQVGNDLDSIASFAAHLHYEQQVSVAQRVQEQIGPAEASAVANAQTDATNNAKPVSWRDVKKFLNDLVESVHDAKADKETSVDKLPKLFSRLLQQLSHTLDFDESKQKLADHIQKQFGKDLKELPPLGEAKTMA